MASQECREGSNSSLLMASHIKVDLDGKLPADIDERVQWCITMLRWPVLWMSYYRTQRGWHLEIALSRTVHPWRLIAAQAILGSDYRRETFNLRRTGNWRRLSRRARDRWNVLFRRKFTFTLDT